jgi:autotransporter-associated beta strand protein
MRYWLIPLLLIFGLWAPAAHASYQTINNDSWWLTTSGTGIYAQSGYISKIGNTYYWWGVEYKSAPTYEANGGGGASESFVAVNCYTSTDLAHWTFQTQALTPTGADSSSNKVSYIGRLGGVFYNATSNLWVMWIVYQSTVTGDGEMCATSSSPLGPFTFNNVQTTFTNVYDSTNGDCTIFLDTANGGTPYFITSDAHGRQHAYVCPLSSNYLSIGAATLISEWPQGQEANDMFERNGLYYYCMSNLAGWSYSSAYEVNSPSILTPSDYTADAAFAGTTVNDTYYSQVTFALPVVGNLTTTYIMVCDRWSELDTSYASAGHGTGFEVWEPLTWNGSTPTFLPLSSYQLDAVTGNWRPLPAFAAPTGLTATPGNDQVALSWDASGGATSYTVQSATAAAGPYTIIASGLTSTTSTDTTPINGATYYYEVAAVNASGTSSYTLPVSVIPSVNPTPAAPGELMAAANTSQVALSWDPAVSATSYIVERATASAGPYTIIATGTSPTATDTAVTYGPTYYYEVAAVDAVGASTNSPPVSANLTGTVSWSGAANGAWDITTNNWLFGSTPALYEDNDTVVFTDTASTTSVAISNTVSPAAVTFSNSALNYTVGGASISGTGGVTLTGTGTLTLTGSNNYSGPTTIGSGATLVVGNAYALQYSTLNFTTGTLSFTAATTAATFGGLQGTNAAQNLVLANTAGAVALTIGGNGSTTNYSGNLTGSGGLTMSGTGAVTLSNANYTGATNVSDGTLTINAGAVGSTGASAAIIVNGGVASVNASVPGILNVNGATVSAPSLENENTSTVNLTGHGTISLTGNLAVNGNNSDDEGLVSLVSGTVTANSVTIGRDGDDLGGTAPTAGSTTDGLYIDGATLNISATLGDGSTANNSSAQMRVDAGSVTVGGITTVTNDASSRYTVLDLNGGSFTDNDTTGVGILVGGNNNSSLDAELLIRGGTVNTSAITLGNSSDNGGALTLTDIGGITYIGSGGIVSAAPSPTVVTIAIGSSSVSTAPIIAASANWTSSAPMTLSNSSGGTAVTFQTANASGTPENITLNGALSVAGGLTQTGAGTLTLGGADTITGAASVTNGIMKLTGSLSGATSLSVSSGAVFHLAGGSLSVSGGITNNGIFKLSGTPALAQTGSFINNGVLDMIDGPQTLPASFTNNGTVLTSSSVQPQSVTMTGSNFTLTIHGYAQHTYQLQSTASLVAPVTWTNVGAPQIGAGSPLTFTDTGGAGGTQGFYQIMVSP